MSLLILLSLWYVTIDCDGVGITMNDPLPTAEDARELAQMTFDGLTDEQRLHCIIGTKERK